MQKNSAGILFLIPPAKGRNPDRIYGCNYAHFFQHNIFILYVIAMVQKHGFYIRFVDCNINNITIEEACTGEDTTILFYSVFLSRKIDLDAAQYIERCNKNNIDIIFLGPDPTYYPEKYATSTNRYVVRGEPEYTIVDLLNTLFEDKKGVKNIHGVSWNDGNLVINNGPRDIIKNIDNLPFPNRTILGNGKYFYNAKFKQFPSTTILTSRGCAFRCYYCVPNSLSYARELEYKRWYRKKPPVTKRSVENILAEFYQITKQGFRSVSVLDDQFIWEEEKTIELMDGIKDMGLEISILTRADRIKNAIFTKKLSQGGVKHITLGVESYSQEILDYIGKDMDVQVYDRAINMIKKAGINPEINILLGSCPLETSNTIKNTFEQVKKHNVEIIHAQICSPFPGTEFHKTAKEKGWITTEDYIPIDPSCEALISYNHLSSKELVDAAKKIYKNHYFNLKYLVKQLSKMRSFKNLKQKILTARNMYRNIFNKKPLPPA